MSPSLKSQIRIPIQDQIWPYTLNSFSYIGITLLLEDYFLILLPDSPLFNDKLLNDTEEESWSSGSWFMKEISPGETHLQKNYRWRLQDSPSSHFLGTCLICHIQQSLDPPCSVLPSAQHPHQGFDSYNPNSPPPIHSATELELSCFSRVCIWKTVTVASTAPTTYR